MIVDILRRPDFTGLEKVLWVIAGVVFSLATLIVYFLWVRKRNYSNPSGAVRTGSFENTTSERPGHGAANRIGRPSAPWCAVRLRGRRGSMAITPRRPVAMLLPREARAAA